MGWMDGWGGRKTLRPWCWIRGFGRGGGVGTFLSAFGSWADAEAGGRFCVLRFGVGERCCLPWYVGIAVDGWVDGLGIMLSTSSSS